MNKVVALVDYKWSGHRPMYLKLYTQILVEKGAKVIVLCERPEEFNEWLQRELPEHQQNVFAAEVGGFIPVKYHMAKGVNSEMIVYRWGNINNRLRQMESQLKLKIDLVFFNYLDEMLEPVHRLVPRLINSKFSYKWSGLIFHMQTLEAQRMGKKWFYSSYIDMLSSPKCVFLTTLLENKVDVLEQLTEKKTLVFPDIATKILPDDPDNYPLTREVKRLAKGRKIVTLVGSIAHRKGLVNMLKAAEMMQDEPFFFVVAGKVTPKFPPEEVEYMLKFLATKPENIHLSFEHVDDPEFDGLVEMSDVIFAAYSGFQSSSNLLTKSALMERPVVVTAGTLMGERVQRLETGLAVKEGDIPGLVNAIKELAVLGPEPFKVGFAKLREENSVEMQRRRFQEILTKI